MEPVINSTYLKNKKQKILHNFQKDTMFSTNAPNSTSTFEVTPTISTNVAKNPIVSKFDTSTFVTPSNIFKTNSPSSLTKPFRFNEKSDIILTQILEDNSKAPLSNILSLFNNSCDTNITLLQLKNHIKFYFF
jgi:hypothetical protein